MSKIKKTKKTHPWDGPDQRNTAIRLTESFGCDFYFHLRFVYSRSWHLSYSCLYLCLCPCPYPGHGPVASPRLASPPRYPIWDIFLDLISMDSFSWSKFDLIWIGHVSNHDTSIAPFWNSRICLKEEMNSISRYQNSSLWPTIDEWEFDYPALSP